MINISISLLVWICIVIAWAFFVSFVLQVSSEVSFLLGMPMGLVALIIAVAVHDRLKSRGSQS